MTIFLGTILSYPLVVAGRGSKEPGYPKGVGGTPHTCCRSASISGCCRALGTSAARGSRAKARAALGGRTKRRARGTTPRYP